MQVKRRTNKNGYVRDVQRQYVTEIRVLSMRDAFTGTMLAVRL